MFDLNPMAQPDAWWQHVIMAGVAALLGFIIGYRTSRNVASDLEEELAELEAQLEDQQQVPVRDGEAKTADSPVPSEETPRVARAVVATPEAHTHDDLKIVEGIGPKIEQLLNKEGILTFRHLSEASPEQILDILGGAGQRFQMHDPGSWPRQAALAAEGKWEELRVWQENLIKGKTT